MARLPIVIRLDGISFEEAVTALAGQPGFFVIDGRGAHDWAGRISIISAFPKSSFSMAGGFVTVDGHTTIEQPYTALSRFCSRANSLSIDPYLPFSGGIAGYIGFEGARALRGLAPARGFSRHSQCRLGLYPAAFLFDHAEGTAALVANGDTQREAMERSGLMLDCLHKKSGFSGADMSFSPDDSRWLPDDEGLAKILSNARAWLRSDSIRHVHIVRHRQTPFSTGSFVSQFLEAGMDGTRRAVFTHEGAAYLISSWDALLRIDGRRMRSTISFGPASPQEPSVVGPALREFHRRAKELCPDGVSREDRDDVTSFSGRLGREMAHVDALVGLMPSHFNTGMPYERALEFIDQNEELHRSLYGGAFGTLDSKRLAFSTIQSVQTAADGALCETVGIDLKADMDEGTAMERLGSVFSRPLPRTG